MVHCFYSHSSRSIFYTFLLLLLSCIWLFGNMMFNLNVFLNFQNFLLLLISNLFQLWMENNPCIIELFSDYKEIFYDPAYYLSSNLFHVCQRIMCIPLLLGRVFYRYLLILVSIQYFSSIPSFSPSPNIFPKYLGS